MTGSTRTRASHHISPLRYPGGKGKLANYVKAIVKQSGMLDATYIEPFTGGGGVGLALLLNGYVSRIVLNDLSKPVYAFWRAMLTRPDEFRQRILTVPLTVQEWQVQRDIFRDCADEFDLGFAAFYLNRTNHSGVLNGGMIGGYAQTSSYGLGARFNREELAARVQRIARNGRRIEVRNDDAAYLIANAQEISGSRAPLVYVDPPYYRKGRDLYYDFYTGDDHAKLRDVVKNLSGEVRWIVSYDNEPEIAALYREFRSIEYSLSYSVKNGRVGRELMFFSDNIVIPKLSDGGLVELSVAA
jgi:DNA adenine methylase